MALAVEEADVTRRLVSRGHCRAASCEPGAAQVQAEAEQGYACRSGSGEGVSSPQLLALVD